MACEFSKEGPKLPVLAQKAGSEDAVDWSAALLRDAVMFWAQSQAEKAAFIDAGGSISYGQMANSINALCGALQGAGVHAGGRIVTVVPSSIEFATLLFATMRMDVNLIPLDILLSGGELEKRLSIVRPALVFAACQEHANTARELGYRTIVMEGGPEGFETLKVFASAALVEPMKTFSELSEVLEKYPVLTIFTSGTTGEPKGVTLSEANLTHAISSIDDAVCCRNDDVFLTALPISHIYGINSGILLPARVGATSVLMPKFKAEAALDTIERHHVSVYNGVPSTYKRMAAAQAKGPRDLSSLRTGSIAGAMCSDLEHYQRVLNCAPHILYGLTESPIIATTRGDDSLNTEISGVGRFIDTVEARIVDEDNWPLDEDIVGEIICKSPGTMLGYLDEPEATRERVDEQGWVYTGDIGYKDSTGYVHVVGRKIDLINRGGYKVYPIEIENVYNENPYVADCCALGFPHAELGQQIVLFVVLKSPGMNPADLRDYARSRIAKYKIPDHVIILDKIPHLANEKPDKQAMAHIYEADEKAFHGDDELGKQLRGEL